MDLKLVATAVILTSGYLGVALAIRCIYTRSEVLDHLSSLHFSSSVGCSVGKTEGNAFLIARAFTAGVMNMNWSLTMIIYRSCMHILINCYSQICCEYKLLQSTGRRLILLMSSVPCMSNCAMISLIPAFRGSTRDIRC